MSGSFGSSFHTFQALRGDKYPAIAETAALLRNVTLGKFYQPLDKLPINHLAMRFFNKLNSGYEQVNLDNIQSDIFLTFVAFFEKSFGKICDFIGKKKV